MPDVDSQLTRALETVAEEGRTRSRAVPGVVIRRTATRRARRRYAAVGATTAVALVAGGVGVRLGNPFGGDDNTTTRVTVPATPDKATDGSPLLTEKEVAQSLGTMWDWKGSPVELTPAKVTPCQAAPAADPARIAAQARVVTGGWSGDDTLTELVEQSATPAAAEAAFSRAVAWFTECGGQGVDQSGAKDSLAKRVAARGPIGGVDEMRVVVRMREHLGTDTWTNTVAAVLRVDDQVAVIAWDNTIDDNPGAYDDGFVQLVQVAAARLTHSAAPVVPDEALLSGTDPAVVSIIDKPHVAVLVDSTKTPRSNLLCSGFGSAIDSVIASRQVQIGGMGNYAPAEVDQAVRAHTNAAAASAAVKLARQESQQCQVKEGGTVSDFTYSGGDESWALSFHGVALADPAYTAVIRVGAGVAFVRVMSENRKVSEDEARAAFDAVAERMTKVYG